MLVHHASPKPFHRRRSSKWPALRKRILSERGQCAACGATRRLEVHHLQPVHLFPDLELVESNLLVLCESRRALNCHLLVGHLGDYRSWNRDAVADAAAWRAKMAQRP